MKLTRQFKTQDPQALLRDLTRLCDELERAVAQLGGGGDVEATNGLEVVSEDPTTIGIAEDGVTNPRLAEMPTLTVKANLTGATANPQDVTLLALIAAMHVITVEDWTSSGTSTVPDGATHALILACGGGAGGAGGNGSRGLPNGAAQVTTGMGGGGGGGGAQMHTAFGAVSAGDSYAVTVGSGGAGGAGGAAGSIGGAPTVGTSGSAGTDSSYVGADLAVYAAGAAPGLANPSTSTTAVNVRGIGGLPRRYTDVAMGASFPLTALQWSTVVNGVSSERMLFGAIPGWGGIGAAQASSAEIAGPGNSSSSGWAGGAAGANGTLFTGSGGAASAAGGQGGGGGGGGAFGSGGVGGSGGNGGLYFANAQDGNAGTAPAANTGAGGGGGGGAGNLGGDFSGSQASVGRVGGPGATGASGRVYVLYLAAP